MAEAATRPGVMGLRSWALAGGLPSWEATARPQRPQARSTPRDFHRSKIVQHSKLAQASGNTLDGAQTVLDSLSKTAAEVCDLTGTESGLPPRTPIFPPAEKDRFFGGLSGTQVEAELRRQAALVKGLLRDQSTLKDSVWRLQDERYEVKHRLETFERTGLDEVRSGVAKTNEQLKALSGQVEILDARVVAADDFSAQFAELACRLELLDARLAAAEEQDLHVWRSCSASGGELADPKGVMDAGPLAPAEAHAMSSWDRQSSSKNALPDAAAPPGVVASMSTPDADLQPAREMPFSPVPKESAPPSSQAFPNNQGSCFASTPISDPRPPSEAFSYSCPSTSPGQITSEGSTQPENEQKLDKSEL